MNPVKTTWSFGASVLLLMAIKTRLKTHMTLSLQTKNTHNMLLKKWLIRCLSIVNEIIHMPPPAKPSYSINNGQLVKCHTKTHFTQERHISSFFHVYRCQSDPPKSRNNDILPTKQATIFPGPNMTRILQWSDPHKISQNEVYIWFTPHPVTVTFLSYYMFRIGKSQPKPSFMWLWTCRSLGCFSDSMIAKRRRFSFQAPWHLHLLVDLPPPLLVPNHQRYHNVVDTHHSSDP